MDYRAVNPFYINVVVKCSFEIFAEVNQAGISFERPSYLRWLREDHHDAITLMYILVLVLVFGDNNSGDIPKEITQQASTRIKLFSLRKYYFMKIKQKDEFF